ncbi:Ldh family oxidoreductase [Uliginosibacterium sp. H3]|uniref:Ldh family oxidoreductase n=1 Tax=Uliginosibacterium silvisoli TaxID=3114758 RepID=A0ABU6JZB1_9RHOO|nr:Ldh family oxidoreductase [Uliginosibacterium sp. H3]
MSSATDQPTRIPYAQLCAAVQSALQAHGVSPEIASIEARIMAEADLHGTPSHGVKMLPALLRGFDTGRSKAQPALKFTREFGAICVLDGDNGPGRYVAATAMQAAVDRARQFGVGVCLATHTTHWGRAHAYALRAAQAGCIGLCSTNAIQTMAAWGATRPVIGNNPLAIGVPRAAGKHPVVLDIAMSQAAVGKVTTWLREGKELPAGWGVDANGKPTTDAKAILGGAVSPMGGHKGAGLALMLEFMTAALGSGLFCRDITAPGGAVETEASKLFIALDVAAFRDDGIAGFDTQVDDYLDYLRQEASTREAFLFPGERGWTEAEINLREGVPLHAEIVAQLEQAGVVLG